MPERVGGFRWVAVHGDQPGGGQLGEEARKPVRNHGGQATDQHERELTPDHGSHLGHRLRIAQPIQPRHQRSLECARHEHSGFRPGNCALLPIVE
jgi:hypothetical protein